MNELNGKNENKKLKKKEKNEISILSVKLLKKYDFDRLLEYVKNLHHILLKKDKKLKKYKDKIKILNKNPSKTKISEPENIEIKKENDKTVNFLDEIREAAEIAQNKNGFIYEPTSGLYYDQKTGYYYNAEYGLYYDGDRGRYYKLNNETNEFEFHSDPYNQKEKVHDNLTTFINKFSHLNIDKLRTNALAKSKKYTTTYYSSDDDENYRHMCKGKKDTHYRKLVKYDDDYFENDYEDGELITGSEDEDKVENYLGKNNIKQGIDKYEDVAKKYPPSMRIIVQETNLTKIKTGTLHIITFKGGTLGREGDHDVVIPDINISKFHLKFNYDEKKSVYQCIDLGSRNGTILNGKRMSTAKQESKLMDIVHGTVIQLSQTKLLCHIHPGNSTCGFCEPGLIIESKNEQKSLPLTHKEQLKKLQKRYGLENEKYVETKSDIKYNDRAAVRRVTVGSSSHHEKTQMASTETEIPSENKGFKMLSKLGWKKGETLGKGNEGLLQPISVIGNFGYKGLGNTETIPLEISKFDMKKVETWKKAQQRYNKLPKSDIFNVDGSDSND